MTNCITMKWAKFRALSWPERRIVVAAAVWQPLFSLGLRVIGLRQFQTWLRRANPQIESSLSIDEIVRIATLVNIAALNVPFHSTCLTRSLLLGWILQRRGITSQLCIGVRLTQGVLDAHAWVEYAGVPINDRPDVGEQFAPFTEILPPGAFQSP
jgi:transglutaminase superfamily protein